MQNSNGLSKNILILTIVLFALIAALSIMFTFNKNPVSSPAPATKGDSAAIDKNVADLNNLDADIASFAEDDAVSTELDETLNEAGEISETAENLTKDEENLNSLGSDLGTLSGDEAIDKEIDQALQEVSL